jgi:uncharacterized protein (DUF2062 family)
MKLTLFNRARAWCQRNMPRREAFEQMRWLGPVAHRILLPELWRFHRRSVPRGVALGIVVGVLIPVAQTIFAALLSLPARANVPVAALTTFITNPLTTPPIWIGAYWVGKWVLHFDAMTPGRLITTQVQGEAGGWLRWLLSDAAPATAVGLILISAVAAVIGYFGAAFLWRWWIAHKWRHRRAHRVHHA